MALYLNGIEQHNITSEVETIEHEHHEQHEGCFYFHKGVQAITGASTVVYFMYRTPNAAALTEIHARAAFAAEDEFTVEIYEGATVSADGAALATFNANRNSANTAGLTVFSGPTVTTPGTLIWSTKVGASRTAGYSAVENHEIIAKIDTNYLFKITKIAAGTHYFDYDFYWYEEDIS